MKLFGKIRRFFARIFKKESKKPRVEPTVGYNEVPPTPQKRKQRFPANYKNLTMNRYNNMVVGAGLLGRQSKGHIEWYHKRLLNGKKRYEKASRIVRLKTGYTIPWQIIGVIHGMEGGFDFDKQILNGQPYSKKTTWVPKGKGPYSSWEESCVDAFTWDDDYKIVPENWGPVETALFNERWNGMSYWNRGRPSPYLWGYTTVQIPGKYTSDHKYDHKAITLQVGVMAQLKTVGFWDE